MALNEVNLIVVLTVFVIGALYEFRPKRRLGYVKWATTVVQISSQALFLGLVIPTSITWYVVLALFTAPVFGGAAWLADYGLEWWLTKSRGLLRLEGVDPEEIGLRSFIIGSKLIMKEFLSGRRTREKRVVRTKRDG